MKHILKRQRIDEADSYLVNLRFNKKVKEWKFTATFDTYSEAIKAWNNAIAAHHSGAALAAYTACATVKDIIGIKLSKAIALRLAKGKELHKTAQNVLNYAQESQIRQLPAADVIRAYAESLSDG